MFFFQNLVQLCKQTHQRCVVCLCLSVESRDMWDVFTPLEAGPLCEDCKSPKYGGIRSSNKNQASCKVK